MQNLLSRLQTRHLRLLSAVAEGGQLSRAAARLSITQPAASRSLSELEHLVGAPLFHRHAKGMSPTPIGAVLIRHARSCLAQLDQAVSEISALQSGLSGILRIGAVTGPAVQYVVPAVQRLKAHATAAEISIDVAPSVDLMAGLLRGEYDMVLCRVPAGVDVQTLEIHAGRVEVVGFVARAQHPLHRLGRLSYGDLLGATWVMQGPGMPIRVAVEHAFLARNLPVPQDTIDTASLLVALSYLKTSDAIVAMTQEATDLIVATDPHGLRRLNVEGPETLQPYHLILPKSPPIGPLAAQMRDLLRGAISMGGA